MRECVIGIRLVLLAVLAMVGAGAGAATLYLKADATGSGTGASWANAYTTFETAVAGLQAAGAGSELRVARGRYRIAATATTLTIANFTIRGGYRAQADGDTVQDPKLYQSTLWWRDMSSMMSANWTHVLFHGDTLSGYTTETTSTRVCEDDGTVNDPPAFTEDYDTYCFGTGGTGGAHVLVIGSGGSGTVEGLNFIGFRAGCVYFSGSNGVTVKKCRFVGNNSVCIWDVSAAQDYVTDCDFIGGFSSTAYAFSIHRNNIRVDNCRFLGNYKCGSYGGGVLHFEQSLSGLVFANCLFTHNAGYSTSESNNAQPGLITGGHSTLTPVFLDSVMTNNASYSLEGRGVPLIGTSVVLKRCRIAANAHYFKATTGRAYSLIGSVYSAGLSRLDGCVIEDNRVEAVQTAFTEGTYHVGIVGGPVAPASGVSCVNTVFRDNVATGPSSASLVCNRCRGVFAMGFVTLGGEKYNRAAQAAIGIANCLFTGAAEDGVCDLMECGFNHEYSWNSVTYYRTVVNSVFQRDGDAPYNPFFVQTPSLWLVRDCSLKNWTSATCPSGLVVTDGLETDEIPFARRTGTMYYEPTVKTPGIRASVNLAVNSSDGYAFAWSNATTGAWVPLCNNAGSTLISGVGSTLMDDAAGAARTADAFTRGPIQPLGGVAESGRSLTIRRAPMSGGTVSSPSSQAVATGKPITPVTATPAEGLTFALWQTEDGATYSAANPLAIAALNEDLVLTAVFAGDVALSFDLGSGGTFEGGSATYVTNVAAGAAFPVLPKITPKEGHVFAGWNEPLPEVVPGVATSYAAQFAVGGIHVVPSDDLILKTSTRDGLTWANATGSIQEAIDRAAEFGGEVWIKTGVYTNMTPYRPRANVTVAGGFVGSEKSADEADPVQHPTILTGDLTGNNYWRANGSKGESRGKIWDGTTLNYPNADGTDWYWYIAGDTTDASYGFLHQSSPAVTNFVLRNLTLTGYRYAAVDLGGGSYLVASNVTFVANNYWNNVDQSQAAVWARSGGRLVGCSFIGNFRAFTVSSTVSGHGNLLADCLFDANYQHGGRDGGGAQFAAAATITNCVFRRHYTGHINSPGAVMGTKTTHFYNCDFIDNRAQGDGRAAVSWLNYGSFNRCRVIGNVASCSTASTAARATCLCLAGGDFFVNDCYFADNRMVGRYTGTGEQLAGVICYVGDGRLQFYNSTFVDSVVAVTNASTGKINAGSFTASSYNHNQCWALVHCTVANTHFAGANESTGELRIGECVNTAAASTAKSSCCGVANSILWNDDDDYVAFYPNQTAWMPLVYHNVIRNFDSAAYEAAVVAGNGDMIEGNSSDDPVLAPRVRKPRAMTPPRVEQLGLGTRSDFRKAAPRFARPDGGKCHVRSTGGGYWHCVLQKNITWWWYGESVSTDAWGHARPKDKIALGPLQVSVGILVTAF